MNNKLLFNNYSNNFNTIKHNTINNQLPENYERAQLNSELSKFNDDNYDFVNFKETVKTWLELDDDIRTLEGYC